MSWYCRWQKCGNINFKKHIYRCKWGADGKPDPDNGKYKDEIPISQSYVKYTGEGRFCLGVCADVEIQEDNTEKVIGKRLALFDYTGKMILSPDDCDEALQKEMKCVKRLKSPGRWVQYEGGQLEHKIYADDTIQKLDKLGKVTKEQFHCYGNYSLKDLAQLTDEKLGEMDTIPNIKVVRWRDEEKQILEGRLDLERPKKVDHRKAENPYESLYKDEWMEKIKNCYITKNEWSSFNTTNHYLSPFTNQQIRSYCTMG